MFNVLRPVSALLEEIVALCVSFPNCEEDHSGPEGRNTAGIELHWTITQSIIALFLSQKSSRYQDKMMAFISTPEPPKQQDVEVLGP